MTTEMTHQQEAQALSQFINRKKNFSKEDLEKTVESSKEKIGKLENKIPDPLTTVWDRIKLMFRALKCYAKGEYREMPWATVVAIGGALLYFISPVDAIVDVVPVLGYLDDAMVIGFGLKLISDDLKRFSVWEQERLAADRGEVKSA